MSDEIQSLGALEAIRVRPEMYVGAGPDRIHPNSLLREAMCMALAEAQCGSCSRIEIQCEGLSASISDNGIGWSTAMHKSGLSFPEMILTQLGACRNHKAHQELAHKLCKTGIVVVTALSSRFSLETVNECGSWKMSFAEGRLELPLTSHGLVARTGTRLSFELDASIFPKQIFDVDALRQWIGTLNLPGVSVMVSSSPSDPV